LNKLNVLIEERINYETENNHYIPSSLYCFEKTLQKKYTRINTIELPLELLSYILNNMPKLNNMCIDSDYLYCKLFENSDDKKYLLLSKLLILDNNMEKTLSPSIQNIIFRNNIFNYNISNNYEMKFKLICICFDQQTISELIKNAIYKNNYSPFLKYLHTCFYMNNIIKNN